MAGSPALVLNDPDAIEQVLESRRTEFRKGSTVEQLLPTTTDYSLFTARQGEGWRARAIRRGAHPDSSGPAPRLLVVLGSRPACLGLRAGRNFMLRNIGAVIAGLFVGSLVNMAFVLLNSYVLFPMPEGMDMMDPERFNAYLATLPVAAFLVVLVAHLGQAFVGGWVAARIGTRPMVLAMIVGALSLLGGIMNAMQIDGPSWMLIEMPLYLVVAFAAGKLVERGAAQG